MFDNQNMDIVLQNALSSVSSLYIRAISIKGDLERESIRTQNENTRRFYIELMTVLAEIPSLDPELIESILDGEIPELGEDHVVAAAAA